MMSEQTEHEGLPPLPTPEYGGVQVPTAACAGAVQYTPPIKHSFTAVPMGPTFTAAQMREYATAAVLAERERCAQIAEVRGEEGHGGKILAFFIRGVPERSPPRNSDGAWFWSERDDQGGWQHYRSSERPEWAL